MTSTMWVSWTSYALQSDTTSRSAASTATPPPLTPLTARRRPGTTASTSTAKQEGLVGVDGSMGDWWGLGGEKAVGAAVPGTPPNDAHFPQQGHRDALQCAHQSRQYPNLLPTDTCAPRPSTTSHGRRGAPLFSAVRKGSPRQWGPGMCIGDARERTRRARN